ncbi:hypothetical protein [Roseateles albus]|uniref:Uncharacterized protein n=1 Tax=Roseateles albus TaxID=2987525 RepID=A0ABT5K838_9BURK|nr:hypothetical protein [Roseateles albus]MDC8770127.1 hypothetical protein [Roseateles albus]
MRKWLLDLQLKFKLKIPLSHLHCAAASMPGVRPGGRLTFLAVAKKSKQKKATLPHGPAGPLSARIRRAAPNSLRYAALKQGARSLSLKSLRDARQILRSSPMQKGMNSKEHGSLRVASMGAALRVRTSHVEAERGQTMFFEILRRVSARWET